MEPLPNTSALRNEELRLETALCIRRVRSEERQSHPSGRGGPPVGEGGREDPRSSRKRGADGGPARLRPSQGVAVAPPAASGAHAEEGVGTRACSAPALASGVLHFHSRRRRCGQPGSRGFRTVLPRAPRLSLCLRTPQAARPRALPGKCRCPHPE